MTRALTILTAVALGSLRAHAQAPTITRDLTIGCESCASALQFSVVFDVAVSPSGEILVADRDAPLLRRFDAAGKPKWSGGTKGRGPGEYQLVIRAGFLSSGNVAVVDMTTQRVTELAGDGKVVSTTALARFPTTAGTEPGGTVVVGAEGPRGTLDVFRWRADALSPVTLPPPNPGGDATMRNSSVAISANGTIAAFLNNERYAIVRLDASGTRLPDLTRAVERVRRTNAEEAELRARMSKMSAMVAAEAGSRGSTGSRPIPDRPDAERSLKPHVTVDALRFDPDGRLWVHTMRGDLTHTVFDVFGATGAYLGAVTIPVAISAFGLGGKYLVTAGENEDGIPQVTRWIVR